VLGLDRLQTVTEEDIRRATTERQPPRVLPGGTILLVQSGAAYPDGPMVSELSKHYRVVPFTGISTRGQQSDNVVIASPLNNGAAVPDVSAPAAMGNLPRHAKAIYRTESAPYEAGSYSRLLRLAAARAGASTVVCYWGILESGTEEIATKTVSWIPVMNWFVPDERQHMRIRLKVAVVDVASGNWTLFSARPLEGKSWSVSPRREVKDQRQVESLKQKAYAVAAQDLAVALR
jgi:hypothetical protein